MTEIERKTPTQGDQKGKRQSPTISLPGLLLLGSKHELIACNSEALNILAYPNKPTKQRDLRELVATRLPLDQLRSDASDGTFEFMSGRRRYRCTAHPLEIHGHSPISTAFLLHRAPSPEVVLCGISARYNLTARERETTGYLLHGLTSKEIAQQMNISPNTVKAFMRLVMTKMGVTTRAGIVGRIAGVDSLSDTWPGDKH